MAYYKATIDVLIDVENEIEAADAISEAMRPILRAFAGKDSSIIDWRYTGTSNYPSPDSGEGFEYA